MKIEVSPEIYTLTVNRNEKRELAFALYGLMSGLMSEKPDTYKDDVDYKLWRNLYDTLNSVMGG